MFRRFAADELHGRLERKSRLEGIREEVERVGELAFERQGKSRLPAAQQQPRYRHPESQSDQRRQGTDRVGHQRHAHEAGHGGGQQEFAGTLAGAGAYQLAGQLLC